MSCEKCNYRNPVVSSASAATTFVPVIDLTPFAYQSPIISTPVVDEVGAVPLEYICSPPPLLQDLFHNSSLLLI